MVGQTTNGNHVQQPKRDLSLDYDVLIVGAGQVSSLGIYTTSD